MFTLAIKEFFSDSLREVLLPYKEQIEAKIPLELLLNFLALADAGYIYYIFKYPEESEEKLVTNCYRLSYQLIREYLNEYPLVF